MNRRGFLHKAMIAAAALAADPELLLWQPAKKTIFIPPTPAFTMSVNFLRFYNLDEWQKQHFIKRMDVLYGWSPVILDD